jgi:general secretion pathway protein F
LAIHQYTYQACDIEGNIIDGQLSAENEQEVVYKASN